MKKITLLSLFFYLPFLLWSQGLSTALEKTFTFETVRQLKELQVNKGEGQAYSWISNNGLHLYYTQIAKQDLLYFSSRDNIQNQFNKPEPIKLDFEGQIISPWLTDDELNLYFCARVADNTHSTTLYHAKRTSIDDEFEIPQRIFLKNGVSKRMDDFFASPSFSPDLNELYIYNSSDVANIYILTKTGTNEYTCSDSLIVPEKYEAITGKLTSDGLRYYLSIEDEQENSVMYFFERETIYQKFEKLYYLDHPEVNSLDNSGFQPSISNNGQFLTFTKTQNNSWSSNALFIAQSSQANVKAVEKVKLNIFSYPTVVKEIVYINVEDIFKDGDDIKSLQIHSAFGENITTIESFEEENIIELSVGNYIKGMYFFYIKTRKGKNIDGRFIIE